jgi:hypothetical protein
MDFTIPPNASAEELDAIAERGMNALFDAFDAGEDVPTVSFLHGDEEEKENKQEEVKTDNNDNDENASDRNIIPDDEIEDSCPVCGHDPCLFVQHGELLLAFDAAEHGGRAPDETPTNNLRRKALYRQLTLLLNNGPLGVGVRKPLPKCCVDAVRELLPSETFMGFMET